MEVNFLVLTLSKKTLLYIFWVSEIFIFKDTTTSSCKHQMFAAITISLLFLKFWEIVCCMKTCMIQNTFEMITAFCLILITALSRHAGLTLFQLFSLHNSCCCRLNMQKVFVSEKFICRSAWLVFFLLFACFHPHDLHTKHDFMLML